MTEATGTESISTHQDTTDARADTALRDQRSLINRLGLVASDIKLAHSVFALPFAVLAAAMAVPLGTPPGRIAGMLALVVVCMVLARSWAMIVNRLVDARIDADNPRTNRRVFAARAMTHRQGWAIALVVAGGFVTVAAFFQILFANPWPVRLAVPVLAWIAFYSLTKRFTVLCHLFLGGALAASPLAAAIAIDPSALGATPALWLIAGMVLLWVAGFDVIYALQDIDFDRANRIHSIPAALGPARAIWLARGLHAGAAGMLIGVWASEPRFGWIFAIAVGLVAALLIAEHLVLAKRGKAGLDMAFFTLNGIVSCVLGTLGILDLLI